MFFFTSIFIESLFSKSSIIIGFKFPKIPLLDAYLSIEGKLKILTDFFLKKLNISFFLFCFNFSVEIMTCLILFSKTNFSNFLSRLNTVLPSMLLPILVLSSSINPEIRVVLLSSSAFFIIKPLTPAPNKRVLINLFSLDILEYKILVINLYSDKKDNEI